MIFFLNSIDYGSIKNLGFNPLHVTLLNILGNTPNLANYKGISN